MALAPIDAAWLRAFARTQRELLMPGLVAGDDGRTTTRSACLHFSVWLKLTLDAAGVSGAVVRGGDGHTDGGAFDAAGRCHGHYWLEVPLSDGPWAVDITGDQFGLKPVRVVPPAEARAWYVAGDQADVDDAVKDVLSDWSSAGFLRDDSLSPEVGALLSQLHRAAG